MIFVPPFGIFAMPIFLPPCPPLPPGPMPILGCAMLLPPSRQNHLCPSFGYGIFLGK